MSTTTHTPLSLCVVAALTAGPAAVASIPVTTAQTEPFAFVQNSGVTMEWESFDDLDGSLELIRASLHVEAEIEAAFTLTNHADVPVDTDAHVIESLLLMWPSMTDSALAIIDVDTVVSCGEGEMLPPGATCDYGGTLVFAGSIDVETTDATTLESFLGSSAIETHIDGFGHISYDGDLYSWSINTHAVSGSATLIYEFRDAETCSEDIGQDGRVGFEDLLAVLMAWGDCVACQEDVDDDGVVGGSDLLRVMSYWGPCP